MIHLFKNLLYVYTGFHLLNLLVTQNLQNLIHISRILCRKRRDSRETLNLT